MAETDSIKNGELTYTPYQTRHTYASTMLSLGENPAWIASQMGHADWGMIRKRYARWIPQIDSSAGEKVMKHLVTNWSQNPSGSIAHIKLPVVLRVGNGLFIRNTI